MKAALLTLPLILSAAAFAQDAPPAAGTPSAVPNAPPAATAPTRGNTPTAPPAPAASVPPDAAGKPPLPVVPPTTPPHTDTHTVSPATPGVNLDAPSDEVLTPTPPPLVPPLGGETPTAEPPAPIDERDYVILDEPVDTVRIDTENRVILEGDVRVRYRGYRIRADRAIFDENRRTVSFEGNVVVENAPYPLSGDYALFNLRTREFATRGGRTVVPPEYVGPNIIQPLRMSGQTLGREGQLIIAEGGFITTCDRPLPHYQIGFRKATIIPDRRIAMRDVTFYRRDRALFRLPYLAIPLSNRRLRYSYLPEVGRTDEEGYYVKTALGYALGEAFPGILRLDLMEKKGIGIGFDQAYQFGKTAAGTLLFYTLRDQNRGVNNLSYRLNHQQALGTWLATLSSDYQQNSYQAISPTSKSRNSTLTLTRTAGGTSTSASYNLAESDYGFGTSKNVAYTITQSERLASFGDVTLRFNGSEYQTAGGLGNVRNQTGDLNARGRLGIFDLEMNANKNFSGSQGGGYFGGTERLPEITLGTDTMRFARGWLGKLPMRLTLGYGRFIEPIITGGSEKTDRALFGLDATPAPIPLIGSLSLQWSGGFRQTVYSDDAAQYVLTTQSQLVQPLGQTSSLNFTYGYQRPYGSPPLTFRLDQSGSFNNAGANLNIETYRTRLTLITGYDIERARSDFEGPKNPWQNLSLQVAFRPNDALQTRFTSAYDINSGILRDLTNRLRIRTRGGFALDTGMRYDPMTKKLAQINGALETPLFGGIWNISAFAGWNGYSNRFEYRNLSVTRSWHDYELTLTYLDQPYGFRSEKGINVMFRLKAFPVYQRTGVGQFGTALDTGLGEVF